MSNLGIKGNSMSIVRAILKSVDEKKPKRLVGLELLNGEERDNIEHYEPYGYTSRLFEDGNGEGVALFQGNDRSLGYAINLTDRRFRPTDLEGGEVCIYDDLKRKIYISRNGITLEGVEHDVTVNTKANIILNADTKITLNAKSNIELNAEADIIATSKANINITCKQCTLKSDNVSIDSPSTNITGNLSVNGTLTASNGTLTVGGGSMSMQGSIKISDDCVASGISLKSHVHGNVQAGSSKTGVAE